MNASLVDPATLFDGGVGMDAQVIGTAAGHADFSGETVRNFEDIEFAHVGGSRTASLFATQLDGVTVFVFHSAEAHRKTSRSTCPHARRSISAASVCKR